jgi:membrane-anchored protein YejM (alkaline phosphatase superfamily)
VFEERQATAVTRDVLSWMDARKTDRPFFAWIHYFDAHAPYRSPLEQSGMHPYDAEIAFVSEQIQVVLDRLGPRSPTRWW